MAFLIFPVQEILTYCFWEVFQPPLPTERLPKLNGNIPKQEKKGCCTCSPTTGIQGPKEILVLPLCCVCQLSLMVHFLMWLVISDYKLISADAAFLGRSRALGYEGMCLQSVLGFAFHVIVQGFEFTFYVCLLRISLCY